MSILNTITIILLVDVIYLCSHLVTLCARNKYRILRPSALAIARKKIDSVYVVMFCLIDIRFLSTQI